MNKIIKIKLVVFLFVLLSNSAWTQENKSGQDPLGDVLYPPELIMNHQDEINLSPEQRESIKNTMISVQAEFTELQWSLSSEMKGFVRLLSEQKVDEATTLEQFKKVLELESKIKIAQMTTMIQLKNYLTGEQIKALDTIKSKLRG